MFEVNITESNTDPHLGLDALGGDLHGSGDAYKKLLPGSCVETVGHLLIKLNSPSSQSLCFPKPLPNRTAGQQEGSAQLLLLEMRPDVKTQIRVSYYLQLLTCTPARPLPAASVSSEVKPAGFPSQFTLDTADCTAIRPTLSTTSFSHIFSLWGWHRAVPGEGQVGAKERFPTRGGWAWNRQPRAGSTALSCCS